MGRHVVVDGSNIATEGRNAPSLAQLSEAIDSFMEEYPGVKITVVVDATFGHRIHKKEVKEFEAAIDNNELVAPPAGAVGRGDAFVLSIAKKVGASVLSNDSYQEFHGQHEWLFDEGRLIGGKPVPNVGWVFVNRVPVRGAVSRRAQRDGKNGPVAVERKPSKAASQPMPVPKSPPPKSATPKASAKPKVDTTKPGKEKNDLLPFLSFVEKHKVGSRVKGVVESYSSHGAFVRIGEVIGYWPMRLMASPQPRRPRDAASIGDKVELVVAGFTPSRRGIDIGVAELVKVKAELKPESKPVAAKSAKRTTAKKAAVAKKAVVKAVKKSAPAKALAKKAPAKKIAKKAPAKKAAKK